MERVFGTLQGRLPQELRLAGIDGIEAANAWLAASFIPAFNARFAIKPEEEGTAFLPFVGDLENILCVQEERVVGNDNCVRYEGARCKSRSRRTGAITSRHWCGSMNIRMARSRSSTARASSSAFLPAALPKRRTPQPLQHRPVLAALKAKPCGRRRGAGLDRHCARAASQGARRDEETPPPPNQRNRTFAALPNPDICACH